MDGLDDLESEDRDEKLLRAEEGRELVEEARWSWGTPAVHEEIATGGAHDTCDGCMICSEENDKPAVCDDGAVENPAAAGDWGCAGTAAAVGYIEYVTCTLSTGTEAAAEVDVAGPGLRLALTSDEDCKDGADGAAVDPLELTVEEEGDPGAEEESESALEPCFLLWRVK